ncbi:hypothetical protein CKAN_01398100 [Cinnamomum micranthum f. kanehirae]|uniref:Pentatricopeptide repeat-containing protein n=1 Tax=Cinnamomum micranthum f. kanehirae TaxID=337451 RepID=A0A443P2U9_9MAGN|nr:hypothetical protein CKAN_01398100 [Cinnamomum micranthum f. kanehirae]
MEASGLSPNKITYITLLDGLCKRNYIGEAMNVVQAMVNSNFQPCIIHIDGLCKHGKIEMEKKVFDSIFDNGLVPDVISYTIMINAFCKKGFDGGG